VNAEEGEKFHNDMDTLGWDELLHSVIKLKFGKQKAESRNGPFAAQQLFNYSIFTFSSSARVRWVCPVWLAL
jgi:hypothetical protein